MRLGQHLNGARQVGLLGNRCGELDATQAEDRQLNGAVGQFQHVLHAHHRADVMDVSEADVLLVLVHLRGHGDVALRPGQLIEQLKRALPPNRQWNEDSRKHDGRLEGQHRQVRRHSPLEIHSRHLRHASIIPRRGPPSSNVGDPPPRQRTLVAHFDGAARARQPCLLRIPPPKPHRTARAEARQRTTSPPSLGPKLPPV